MKSANAFSFMLVHGLKTISCSPKSIAQLASFTDFSGFSSTFRNGIFMRTSIVCDKK